MTKKALTIDSLNQNLRTMEYAVRGLVPSTAGEIAKELEHCKKQGIKSKYPFEEILYCNIGNPQSVGQHPITYYRNVLALVDAPHLLQKPECSKLFPSDCIRTAKDILKHIAGGTGAYSHSQGVEHFRKSIAAFIEARDGHECDQNSLFLTNGASTGIHLLLTTIISDPSVGVLVPIPQYPIYSALIALFNGTQIGYDLDESKGWGVDIDVLRRNVDDAKKKGIKPRALVVINPGNPTGNVLTYDDLKDLLQLCKDEGMIMLADEVYQSNIYNPKAKQFISAKKVLRDNAEFKNVELVSFHSTSKGLLGECGRRGGYMELCNIDPPVFAQILKLASSALCANLDGQVMTHLMVSPPVTGDESFAQFKQENDVIFNSLKRKSEMLHKTLNSIDGIDCQPLEGAMYAFPNILLPVGAINEAKKKGLEPDVIYCLSLLNETGICVVPGTGFGKEGVKDGWYHIRLTFLPEEDKLKKAMESFKSHHHKFIRKYA